MHGVVSLLDDEHTQLVKQLWSKLAERFDVHGIYTTPYPHISYQIAEGYELQALESVLHRFTESRSHFRIRATGLGVFTGEKPVLYLPVVRDGTLAQMQRDIWPALSAVATGVSDYYHPRNWLPHITLAQHDLNPDNLSVMVNWLVRQELKWDIAIDNLALIHDSGQGQELKFCFRW